MSSGDVLESPTCVRCHDSIVTGHAYELGDERWHTHCFSCYKCEKLLGCESDFLVLGTGALICFDCSDSCKKCGKKIDDLAIILSSSNEAYCSECFKCCKCDNQIEDLRYAKTKKGLFCLNCHERLLAKKKLYETRKKQLKKELPKTPKASSNTSGSEIISVDFDKNHLGSNLSLPPERSVRRPQSPVRVGTQSQSKSPQVQSFSENYKDNNSSIDDLLKSTLHENDSDQEDSNLKELNAAATKNLLNRTPLKNEPQSKHPSSKAGSPTFEDQVFDLEESLDLIIDVPPRSSVSSRQSTASHSTKLPNHQEQIALAANNVTNALATENVTKPPSYPSAMHGRSSSHDTKSSTAPIPVKTIKRAMTTKSKSIIGNLMPKTSHHSEYKQTDLKETTPKNSPTAASTKTESHSGWAPTPPLSIQSPHSSHHSKTGSDNLVSSVQVPKQTTSTNVAVFRTPPIESSPTFAKVNITEPAGDYLTKGKTFDDTPTHHLSYSKQEAKIHEAEKTLALLMSQITELNSVKSQLLQDIDDLKLEKNNLKSKVEISVSERPSFTSADSQLSDVNMKVPYQTATASIARAAKPKFWKLFTGGKQESSVHSHHSTSSANNVPSPSNINSSNSRIEISKPVLQNLTEFGDVKLMPLTNQKTESTNSSNVTDKGNGEILFGSTLVSRCHYEGVTIPFIILTCIRYIESSEEHMKTEGIYRKSGSKLLIDQIEKEFSGSKNSASSKLVDLMHQDINGVSGVLKGYLRTLPNPLLPFQLYESLITLVRNNNLIIDLPIKDDNNWTNLELLEQTIGLLKNLFGHLPKEHYDVLEYLTKHLRKISNYEEWNLMSIRNLSLVFAPGIIKDYTGEKELVDMKERNYIVEFILRNSERLFV